MAKYFGTGEINGAYRIAQTGTLVPINFLTSDSLNSAFIPLYKKYLLEDVNKAETFKWCMFVCFFLLSLMLFLSLYFFSELWVSILAPGLNDSAKALSINLLKIMAICCPFYLCSILINYISMAHDDFKPMSMRSPIQNVGMLLGVISAFYLENYSLLAWGFTGSYVFFCIWVLTRSDARKIISFPDKFLWIEVKKVMKSFWRILRPLLIMPIILQGNITLERALSSLISTDAVSALDYARFITDTVVFFLSVPIAFAGLSIWAAEELESVKAKLIDIYLILIILGGAVSFFIFFYAKDIVYFLFHRGEFNVESVISTTSFVQGMCLGLWAQVIGYIFLKALSSHLKNKQVLCIMVASLLVNSLFNLFSYKYLGALGIGIGSSLYGICLLVFSSYVLGIRRGLLGPFLKVCLGVALYALAMYMFPFMKIDIGVPVLNILINGFFFCIYFSLWCLVFPQVRKKFLVFVIRVRSLKIDERND